MRWYAGELGHGEDAEHPFISIEDIAHNLKSNSLVYGLEKLSKEAKALELYSSKQDIAKVTEVYNNLKGIYKKSLELLKANE